MRRLITLAGSVALVVTIALPAFAGNLDETYLDRFSAQNLTGNDGTTDYSGPWIEIGESDGPTSGYVQVTNQPFCDGEFCLKIGGADNSTKGHGVYRSVDLTGATRARLTFECGRELLGENSRGTATVQVSPDGGDTWVTVKTFPLDSDDGELKFRTTIVITDWATPDTMIRFMITEAADLAGYWLIDNVTVVARFEEPATKAPNPTTTTTVPPTTTTTKAPEPTTTTTAPVTATTTTKPSRTTTTTMPQGPTATMPQGPTRTTSIHRTTTSTAPPLTFDEDVSPEDRDTMMNKSSLTVTAALPAVAMPTSTVKGSSPARSHAEPVEALAAAFFTDAGDFGGSLLPSMVLGIVIAVVSLIGIGSRKKD
ncbi:MAG: hypothetical protein V3S28_05160 [Acidimicrobiia bacterium]